MERELRTLAKVRPRGILLRPVPVLRECTFAQERDFIDTKCRLFIEDRHERSLGTRQLHMLCQPHSALFVHDCFHSSNHARSIRPPRGAINENGPLQEPAQSARSFSADMGEAASHEFHCLDVPMRLTGDYLPASGTQTFVAITAVPDASTLVLLGIGGVLARWHERPCHQEVGHPATE